MLEIKYGNPKQQQEDIELPKNIRQMGTPGQKHKIYIEDYVYTYVHQFLVGGEATELRAAVLLGKCVCSRERIYTFVSGAVACKPEFWQEQLGGEEQAGLYQTIKTYFDDLDILGWYLYEPGSELQIRDEIQDFYMKNRGRGVGLFYYADPTAAMEQVFMLEQDRLQDVGGFYIYYEKNAQMQEYMVSVKEDEKTEKKPLLFWKNELEEEEYATEPVREEPKGKTEQKQTGEKKKTVPVKAFWREKPMVSKGHGPKSALVYAACVALLILVSAVGITQIGNYQSMKNLEQAIQVLSGAVKHDTGLDPSVDFQTESGQTMENGQADTGQGTGADSNAGEGENPDGSQEAEGGQEPDSGTNADAGQGTPTDPAADAQQTDHSQDAGQAVETSAEVADYLDQGYYIVQQGDSIAKISRKIYNSLDMVDEICEKNGLQKTDLIFVGQKLELP